MTGHKIAMLRTQANLTQEQLAEKLYVTRELVSKWETGKRNPDYKTIVKLVIFFVRYATNIFFVNCSLS